MNAELLTEIKPLPPDVAAAALQAGASYLVVVPVGTSKASLEECARSVRKCFEEVGARAIICTSELKVYQLKGEEHEGPC